MNNSAWFDDGDLGLPPSQDTPCHSPGSFTVGRSISWVMERDLLCQFGDRRTRAVLAIMMARRCARTPEFFIPPQIAERFGLSARDLCWALNDLEGKLLKTITSTKGKFRKVRLLLEAEERAAGEEPNAKPPAKAPQPRFKLDDHFHHERESMDPAVQWVLEEFARQKASGEELT
jgi:hypothetical protein